MTFCRKAFLFALIRDPLTVRRALGGQERWFNWVDFLRLIECELCEKRIVSNDVCEVIFLLRMDVNKWLRPDYCLSPMLHSLIQSVF